MERVSAAVIAAGTAGDDEPRSNARVRGGGSNEVMSRTRRRGRAPHDSSAGVLRARCAAVPDVAPAHPGGMAADGCHRHRASDTCHCHRAGASRPGCTSDFPGDGSGDKALPGGEAVPGAARTPADAANRPPVGTPPAPPEWIRIATWNLNRLHWRTGGALWRGAVARSDEDYRILARYARALDADVIAFQEVNGPDAAAVSFLPATMNSISPDATTRATPTSTTDSRYARGGFDQVVKRDYEPLGLATGSRYQLRWGVDLLVSGDGRRLRLLNVHLKSKCFSKSLRSPRSRSCRTLARRPSRSRHGLTRVGARVRRSWCWEISTVKWTDTASATICGPPSRTATLRDSSSTGCLRAATRPAGEGPRVTTATQSISSCSAHAHGCGWTHHPSDKSSGPMRMRTRAAACPPITVRSPWISRDYRIQPPRPAQSPNLSGNSDPRTLRYMKTNRPGDYLPTSICSPATSPPPGGCGMPSAASLELDSGVNGRWSLRPRARGCAPSPRAGRSAASCSAPRARTDRQVDRAGRAYPDRALDRVGELRGVRGCEGDHRSLPGAAQSLGDCHSDRGVWVDDHAGVAMHRANGLQRLRFAATAGVKQRLDGRAGIVLDPERVMLGELAHQSGGVLGIPVVHLEQQPLESCSRPGCPSTATSSGSPR